MKVTITYQDDTQETIFGVEEIHYKYPSALPPRIAFESAGTGFTVAVEDVKEFEAIEESMEAKLAVAIESGGKIVETVLTTEESLDKTVSFMLNPWQGAKELKAKRCNVIVGEEVGMK